jgi:2-polyprenyl-3-methyl-5-hydroxy-6-metoxy-1,4-benzoquinol methylase
MGRLPDLIASLGRDPVPRDLDDCSCHVDIAATEETQRVTDFRDRLYARYVTCFKASAAVPSDAAFALWANDRYLPHLSHLPKHSRILEIGCGDGRMLSYLRSKGYVNALGIDGSAEQIARARRRNVPAAHAEVFDFLRGQKEEYDGIIAIDVLEHFTKEELLDLFMMAFAAMKPGASILLQTVNGDGIFAGHFAYGDLTHMTILNEASLGQILRFAGFADERFEEAGPAANSVSGIFRAGAWSVVRLGLNVARGIESGEVRGLWTGNMICSARKPA